MPIANHLEEKSVRIESQRMAHTTLAHRVGASVLVEEAEVGHESAGQREEYA